LYLYHRYSTYVSVQSSSRYKYHSSVVMFPSNYFISKYDSSQKLRPVCFIYAYTIFVRGILFKIRVCFDLHIIYKSPYLSVCVCATYLVLLTNSSIGSTLFVYLCLSVGTCSCMCVRLLFVLPTSKGLDPCGVGNEDFFPVVTLLVVTRITGAHSDIAQCTVDLYWTYLAFMAALYVWRFPWRKEYYFLILVIDSSGGQDLLFSTSEVIAGFADVGC
jgi:hypothetical protein